VDALDWEPWLIEPGLSVLEAVQLVLAARWARVERAKETVTAAPRMLELGRCQERVLASYFDALERANRRDLARCLLLAVRDLLRENPPAERWVRHVNLRGQRLADRAEIYRAALALMLAMGRLQRWQQEARMVTYFDEGYAASQLWKADWERLDGDRSWECVQALHAELAPMKS
jgi:hypothetical protein